MVSKKFLEVSPMQKEVLLSHEDHAYEGENHFGLKENKPSQRNSQNQLSHPCQECQGCRNVKGVWMKERFTFNKSGTKASNICKVKF